MVHLVVDGGNFGISRLCGASIFTDRWPFKMAIFFHLNSNFYYSLVNFFILVHCRFFWKRLISFFLIYKNLLTFMGNTHFLNGFCITEKNHIRRFQKKNGSTVQFISFRQILKITFIHQRLSPVRNKQKEIYDEKIRMIFLFHISQCRISFEKRH